MRQCLNMRHTPFFHIMTTISVSYMNKLMLTAVATAVAACGYAADAVSLDSCRSMALRNNKMIRMAEETVKGAGYARKAATAAYLPGIDFTGTYFYNQRQIELLGADAKLPTMRFDPATQQFSYNVLTAPDGTPVRDPATGGMIPTEVAVIHKEAMEFDTHNVFAGAFTLTQPIFMGGQIRALNEIAKYGELTARSARNAVAQEVVYTVDEAYWLVVSLRAKQRLAEGFVNLVDSLNNSVRAFYDNGMATRSDVLSVDVRLNEAQIARVKVDNGLALARMALAQMCGVPVDTEMRLADEELKDVGVCTAMPVYDMEDVYARRQDLEVLRQGINLMKSKEKLALGTMLPKISAVGMYSFSNPNVIHGFEKKFGGGFSVGAAVTIPLWHWGGNYNQYRVARSATKAQALLLEDAEEKVNLQVSQARFKMTEARKTYDMTLVNMDKADENLRQARLGYREGVLTLDDVTAAQTAWLKAHSEKIDAEIGIRLCDTYLAKVLGQLAY